KVEVRFRDKDGLYNLIRQAVSLRLQAADLTARMQLKTRKEDLPVSEADLGSTWSVERTPPAAPVGAKTPLSARPKEMPSAARSTMPPRTPALVEKQSASPPASAEMFSSAARPAQAAAVPVAHDLGTEPDADFRSPRALQVLDCYLVVEVPPDEVLFID